MRRGSATDISYVTPLIDALFMSDNLDPMDDLAKRRRAQAASVEVSYVDALADMTDLVCDIEASVFDGLNEHLVNIGLQRETISLGLVQPVFTMLQMLGARLHGYGLSVDAASQVLYGCWRGREQIPELASLPDHVRLQTRRLIDIMLDELVFMCALRDAAPQIAWFAISTGIDSVAEREVPSLV